MIERAQARSYLLITGKFSNNIALALHQKDNLVIHLAFSCHSGFHLLLYIPIMGGSLFRSTMHLRLILLNILRYDWSSLKIGKSNAKDKSACKSYLTSFECQPSKIIKSWMQANGGPQR
jgi:hypothetical protein